MNIDVVLIDGHWQLLQSYITRYKMLTLVNEVVDIPLLSRAAHLSPISRAAAATSLRQNGAWYSRASPRGGIVCLYGITVVYRRPPARRCAAYIKLTDHASLSTVVKRTRFHRWVSLRFSYCSRPDDALRYADVGSDGDAGARLSRRCGSGRRTAVLLVQPPTSRHRGRCAGTPPGYHRDADDRVVVAATTGRTAGPTWDPTARISAISRTPAAQDSGGRGGTLWWSTFPAIGGISSLCRHQSYWVTSAIVRPLRQSTAWKAANIHHTTGALIFHRIFYHISHSWSIFYMWYW